MPSPPQTARSERTREALRRAAMVRFLAHGVEETSAEQIAEDAGVSLRTFYRHFSSKHDLLFADYDAGLQWFRRALAERPPGEPLVESVHAAIYAFPSNVEAITEIAALRADELDPGRIVRQIREIQSDFSCAIRDHLVRRSGDPEAEALEITVTARCVAAAIFAGMEVWMQSDGRSFDDLAAMCRTALDAVERGLSMR